MSGDRIHVFEKDSIPGGACDGYEYPGLGYVMQGDREMDMCNKILFRNR